MTQSANLERLKKDLVQTPLALLVGAGVTAGLVPTWPLLLERLLDKAVDVRLGSRFPKHARDAVKSILAGSRGARFAASPYAKAGIIRRFLGQYYLHELRRLLYGNLRSKMCTKKLSLATIKTKGLLHPVARLCTCPRVHAVVTYNFDDLLEREVTKMGRTVSIVSGARQGHVVPKSLPFYHVHGCLPLKPRLPETDTSQVVFALEELFGEMLTPFSWQSVAQLFLLRNYTCLFVGASLTDPDMLRMLSHARAYCLPGTARCYGLMCRSSLVGEEKGWERAQGDLAIRIWAAFADDMGMRLILTGDDHESEAKCIRDLAIHLAT